MQFKDKADAQKAIQELDGKDLKGQQIKVEKYQKTKNQNLLLEKKNIYIKNFPSNWTKEQVENFLKENIENIGQIQSHGIFEKEIDGQKKFFAFYAFEKSEDAKKAIENFNNKKIYDEGQENLTEEDKEGLYVGFAQSKKERRD